MKTYVHLWSYLSEFFLEWEMIQTKVVGKIETHILCSLILSKNRDVYEIKWENTVQPDRHAGYLRLLTHTHCIEFCTAKMVTRTRLKSTFIRTLPFLLFSSDSWRRVVWNGSTNIPGCCFSVTSLRSTELQGDAFHKTAIVTSDPLRTPNLTINCPTGFMKIEEFADRLRW
jgi:hypothetical protein